MIQPANLLMLFISRDGEIGRRSGLKIRRGQKPCGGSIPPPGTSNPKYLRGFESHLLSGFRHSPFLPGSGCAQFCAHLRKYPADSVGLRMDVSLCDSDGRMPGDPGKNEYVAASGLTEPGQSRMS